MKVKVLSDVPEAQDYRDLTPGNQYHVLQIRHGDYRVISDEGMPYLYPSTLFEVVDSTVPEDWIEGVDEDGNVSASPVELQEPGLFEAYFDGDREAWWQVGTYMQKRTGRSK